MYNLEKEVKKTLQVSFVYIFARSNLGRIFKPRDIDGNNHQSIVLSRPVVARQNVQYFHPLGIWVKQSKVYENRE